MEKRRNKFFTIFFVFLLSILFIGCNKQYKKDNKIDNKIDNKMDNKVSVSPLLFSDLQRLQLDSIMNSSCPENFINTSGEFSISLYEDDNLEYITEFSNGSLIKWKSISPEYTAYTYKYDEKGELKEENVFELDENGMELECPALSKKYVYSLGENESIEFCEIYRGNELYQTVKKTKYNDGYEFEIKPQLGSQKVVSIFFDDKGRIDYESYSYLSDYSQTWNFIEYKYDKNNKVIEIYEYVQKNKTKIDIRRCIYEYNEYGNLIKEKEITYDKNDHEKQEVRNIEFSEHDVFGHWQKKVVYLNNEILFEEKRIVKKG